MDKPFLTDVTENASHQKSMEDTALKALYALVFLLSSFAATSAQTSDASMIAAYYLDDGCKDVIEQSTTPAQIVATQASIEIDEANGFAIAAANDEKDGTGALELSDEPQTVRQLTRAREQPTAGDNVGVAIAAANDAEDGPVGAAQSSDEARAVDYPIEYDDKPAVSDASDTVPAQIVTTTEPATEKLDEADDVGNTAANDVENSPVGAFQLGDETQTEPTVDDTVEQITMAAQVVATEPTIEKPGEADDIATIAANDLENGLVGAIQPSDDPPTVDNSTLGNDDLAVDDTIILILIDRQLGLSNE
jgi:hypothetical protein